MTAYELALERSKIDARIDYFNECLNGLDSSDLHATVKITRNTIEEIKLDYYRYKTLVDEELKRR